ncbi:hypothetical protein DFS34DRAFT_596843 [Phlyctochytrium arcticum]|nr:hypothetical protein DFS34DRAFT_598310 [Phlyctochytrium arcticum]KAI9091809.1 hypothetical protein DFS34DRAFT_596843 [Phlyctochytrium arcticum]
MHATLILAAAATATLTLAGSTQAEPTLQECQARADKIIASLNACNKEPRDYQNCTCPGLSNFKTMISTDDCDDILEKQPAGTQLNGVDVKLQLEAMKEQSEACAAGKWSEVEASAKRFEDKLKQAVGKSSAVSTSASFVGSAAAAAVVYFSV